MPSKKIVNVTAQIVARNILDTVADAPVYPYQRVFSTAHYQQMLVARVLGPAGAFEQKPTVMK